jgi:hypothetical protein
MAKRMETQMKINKTILKQIIKEELNALRTEEPTEDPQQTSNTDDLIKRFANKVSNIAKTELAQIDDVHEILNMFIEVLRLLQSANPSDFTHGEIKRVGYEMKKLGALPAIL